MTWTFGASVITGNPLGRLDAVEGKEEIEKRKLIIVYFSKILHSITISGFLKWWHKGHMWHFRAFKIQRK